MSEPRDGRATDVDQVLAEITEAVKSIRFGSIEIVIHDGRVVQIVRTERVRVDARST